MAEVIGVVGAGTMGSGIAQVAARAGYQVVLRDVKDEFLARGMQAVDRGLQRDVEKGRLGEEEKRAVVGRIRTTTELSELAGAGFVVEAITENLDAKRELFRALDAAVGKEAVLASNTSSISITRLGAATDRPEKFIGMHFMNPVPVMKLVEIIRGLATSDETTRIVVETSEKLGKTVAEAQDYPGFVSNRILMPMINEAVFCLMEGVADREAIDTVMKLGMNHPMGPLALADFIGLDTCLAILEVMHRGLGDPKYRPCPLLRKYVAAGWLGRKSGRGFYQY